MNAASDYDPASRRRVRWATTAVLTFSGAAAFWLANLAISLTPIAADYRAALSISYVPMLVQALLGGVILGSAVSVALVRFAGRIPGHGRFQKSLVLSLAALAMVTVVIEIPAKFLGDVPDPMRYLLIATVFNAVRILALGAVVGAVASHRPA
ncbi:hypothetical protein ACWDTI_24105 [Gordonia sp. NPDC003424]